MDTISTKRLNVSGKSYSQTEKSANKSGNNKSTNLFYRFFYYVGIQVLRYSHSAARSAGRLLSPVKEFLIMLFHKGIVNRITRFGNEFRNVKKDFGYAAKRMRRAKEIGVGETLIEPLRIITDGVRKHRDFTSRIFNIVAPALSILLLLLTVNHYLSLNYALRLDYAGETIGYVENEAVYTQAAEMVNQKIVGSAENTLSQDAKFSLAVVNTDEMLNSDEVCDTVLGLTDGEFEEAYGLVVNGETIGAIRSAGDLQFILDDFLESYKSRTECDRVEFIDNIEVEHGYYPVDSIKTSDTLKTEITTTHPTVDYYTIKSGDSPILISEKNDTTVERLRELNPDLDTVMYPGAKVKVDRDKPVLGVKSISHSTYHKTLAYSTTTVTDNSKYKDYKSLKTAGQKGRERYVEEITYVDGEEISRVLIEQVVEVQPVNAVYVVGTKARPVVSQNKGGTTNNSDSSVGRGKFAWPVPGVRSISSPFGKRWGRMHKGIDISTSGIRGRTIVAAASGTVTTVGHDSSGYGNYCIVTHSGGYSTLYAHCQSIQVSRGQKVGKGQAIAKVGNTGRSTGPHLHFEIRVSGVQKNPMNYY